MPLKRHIKPASLLFAAVGGIIGSGWLFAPFYAAQQAGPAALVSWLIGGLMILVIALCFTEVSVMLPLSGGIVRFIKFTHGSALSFLISWCNWLAFVAVPAIEVQATLSYSSHFFPRLLDFSRAGHPLSHFGLLIATGLMLVFVLLNMAGVKIVSRLNDYFVYWKLAVPLLVITCLLLWAFHQHHFCSLTTFAPFGIDGIVKAITAGGVVFSFIGFRQAIELAGEAKNPSKSIPFAVIISIVICFVFYMLLQTAFIGAINPKDVANGWKHLQLIGESSPLLNIAATLGITWLVSLLYIDAVVSPSGTGLIHSASTARILYAASQSGFLSKRFSETNRFGTPVLAVLINFIVGMSFFLPFPSWQSMMEILASLSILAYSIGPICLLCFRRSIPNAERAFKLKGANFFAPLAFIFSNVIIVWSGWDNLKKLALLLLVGFVLFVVFLSRHMTKQQLKSSIWFVPYFLGLVLLTYLSHSGGLGILNLYTAAGITIVFSLLILVWVIKSQLPSEEVQRQVEPILSQINRS